MRLHLLRLQMQIVGHGGCIHSTDCPTTVLTMLLFLRAPQPIANLPLPCLRLHHRWVICRQQGHGERLGVQVGSVHAVLHNGT